MVYTNETVAFYRGDPWAAPGLDANGNRDDLPQLEILTPTEMLQDHDLKNHINVSGAQCFFRRLADLLPPCANAESAAIATTLCLSRP